MIVFLSSFSIKNYFCPRVKYLGLPFFKVRGEFKSNSIGRRGKPPEDRDALGEAGEQEPVGDLHGEEVAQHHRREGEQVEDEPGLDHRHGERACHGVHGEVGIRDRHRDRADGGEADVREPDVHADAAVRCKEHEAFTRGGSACR